MNSLFAIDYSWLIPLLPLLGAAIAGFMGARWLKQQSHWPIWLGVGASAVLSVSLLFGMLSRSHHGELTPQDVPNPYVKLTTLPAESAARSDEERKRIAEAREASAYRLAASVDWYTWIEAGSFKATVGFFFDPLTGVMLCVVTGIGFFITVFAAGYMKGEAGYFRFFAYLGLFIFAMTMLVLGNNFVMLYLGWEGVGLCSYLLIGYYYDKPAAREAAKKAFLVNRVGDFGFGLGIMLIYTIFGTVSYFGSAGDPGVLKLATNPGFIGQLEPWKAAAVPWIPFLLMIGAFGKSAQFPLHVWLPDAMEGPTPVSALIHAATMVTAGVYMIVRCSSLFVLNPAALWTIAAIGAFTALFAATIALRQFDLKKVFAYSTVSQLGFMFVGVAVLAPVAGVFHLVTHAFFKALLFLSSGVVMHAMAGELDMRKMSGLKRVLPKTRWLMLIGCLALAGVIPFSGFWSKDEIVIAAWERSRVLGLVMLVTAFLTAYYSFRLYFRVFEGPEMIPAAPAGHGHSHAADTHAAASASAIRAGDPHESGVDDHLTHKAPAHDHGGHGRHGDHGHHNHEPALMIIPLVVLAIGAVFGGLLNVPGHALGHFLGSSPSLALGYNYVYDNYGQLEANPHMWGYYPAGYHPASHQSIMLVSILIALLGVLVAYVMHLKDRPRGERLAGQYPFATRLLEAKYWVDEVYQAGIVEPLRRLGRAFFVIDQYVVDGIIWVVSFIPQIFGFSLRLTTQRGYLQGYAVMMLLGVALILLVMFMS